MAEVFGYVAHSVDGFIAGPGDDLSFLPSPENGEDFGFAAMLAQVGCMLMGRRTFDVVQGFGGPWPYGQLPILVATHRPLPVDAPPTVQAVSGALDALVAQARAIALERDVYVDGGQVLAEALGLGLVDRLTLTSVPVLLGGGVPLSAGLKQPVHLLPTGDECLPMGLIRRCFRVLPTARAPVPHAPNR